MTQSPERSSPENKLSMRHLQEIDWKRYEVLCRDYFQEKGFQARLTDIGADGGIDIILSRFSENNKPLKVYVQCKAWSQQKVGVQAIREFYGVMASDKVSVGVFMTTSDFTRDAKAFAEGKKLQLISGERLLALISKLPVEAQQRLTETALSGDYKTPTCPNCDIKMMIRTISKGKNSGMKFWGCTNYPKCKHKFYKKGLGQDPKPDFEWEHLGGSFQAKRPRDFDESVASAKSTHNASYEKPKKTSSKAVVKLRPLAFFVVGIFLLYFLFTTVVSSFKAVFTDPIEQHRIELLKQEQSRKKLEEEKRRREQSAIEQQRQEAIRIAEQNRIELEEQHRKQKIQFEKDRAFSDWYNPPWKCEGYRANDNMVECVNHRQDAKAQFEQIWSERNAY